MTDTMNWYDVALRLGVACLLGGALGIEREARGRDAGLRTHMLLALGSALFAAASVGAFDAFVATRSTTNVVVDVTRIASYVAPGVGFIGAGVIVKQVRSGGKPLIHGLTTATSLWSAAAVGVAAGLGFWAGAVAATVLALAALAAVRPVSDWIDRRSTPPRRLVRVDVVAARDHAHAVLERITDDRDVMRAATRRRPAGDVVLTVSTSLASGEQLVDVVRTVSALTGVVSVTVEDVTDEGGTDAQPGEDTVSVRG